MPERNNKLFDTWSLTHIFFGILFGWVMNPFVAFIIMAIYEPLEIFLASPVLSKLGIVFGHEGWRNSLADIFFNAIGIAFGALVLADLMSPPFYLF